MASPEQIARILLDQSAVLVRPREPFQFASGILSPIYCDNRVLLSDVPSRKAVVEALSDHARTFKPAVVAGTATAGIAWGAWLAESLALPLVYVRGEAKEHGKKKRVEGRLKQGDQVVLIEDLVSTGGSVFSACDALREEGARVVAVIAIFSYGFADTKAAFQQRNLPLKAATDLDALLTEAIRKGSIRTEERHQIDSWRRAPQTWRP